MGKDPLDAAYPDNPSVSMLRLQVLRDQVGVCDDVVVDEQTVRPMSLGNASVPRRARPRMALLEHAELERRMEVLKSPVRLGIDPVEDNDDFEALQRLRLHRERVKAGPHHPWAVPGRDHHAELWRHGRQSLPGVTAGRMFRSV
jgi:hypothetical protein